MHLVGFIIKKFVTMHGRARQATDTVQALCMPDNYGKNTHTHTQNTAFPQQQWLPKCASILHLYVHCLSCFS